MIESYDAVRPLTLDERTVLPDPFAAYVAADGGDDEQVVAWRIPPHPISESCPAQAFLDLVADEDWRGRFGHTHSGA
ncbi:MAG TPA: hypothetical protein VIM10_01390 [Actinopolymorphaceae bacterium]